MAITERQADANDVADAINARIRVLKRNINDAIINVYTAPGSDVAKATVGITIGTQRFVRTVDEWTQVINSLNALSGRVTGSNINGSSAQGTSTANMLATNAHYLIDGFMGSDTPNTTFVEGAIEANLSSVASEAVTIASETRQTAPPIPASQGNSAPGYTNETQDTGAVGADKEGAGLSGRTAQDVINTFKYITGVDLNYVYDSQIKSAVDSLVTGSNNAGDSADEFLMKVVMYAEGRGFDVNKDAKSGADGASAITLANMLGDPSINPETSIDPDTSVEPAKYIGDVYKYITAQDGTTQEISDELLTEALEKYPNPANTHNDLFDFLEEKAKANGDFITSSPGVDSGSPSGSGAPVSTLNTTNRKFKLIRGTGDPTGVGQIRGNGNAVFIVSESGELFHVTENLANELRANSDWYEPDVISQTELDGMALRTSLNHTAELGILKIPPAGEFLLVKGTGVSMGGAQLSGNGDAVYAIDKNGNRYHVTAEVAQQMKANNSWMEPAVLNQNTIDGMDLNGALASPSGGTTTVTVPIGDPTVVHVVGANVDAPNGKDFRLIQGKGPSLGETQLRGNGAAVFALYSDGTKLHVTAEVAKALQDKGLWVNPEQWEQADVDALKTSGRLLGVDGGIGELTIPDVKVTVASSAPTSTPAVATPNTQAETVGDSAAPREPASSTPTATTTVFTDLQYDKNGEARYLDDPKYGYTEARKQELRSHFWGGGTWAEVDQIQAIYDSGNQEMIDAWERYSGTGAYAAGATPAPAHTEAVAADPEPVAAPAAPVTPAQPATPAMQEPLADRTGDTRDLAGLSEADKAMVRQHIVAGGGTWTELKTVSDIYASGDAARIEGWELMTKTGKYSPTTAWGQTYHEAIANGNTHEDSAAWATGYHGAQVTSTPVPTIIPPAQTTGQFGV